MLKKKTLSVTALLLSVIITVTSCSAQESSSGTTTESDQSATIQEGVAEENGVKFYTDQYPVVDEPITITIATNQSALTVVDFNDMPVVQKLEELTGIHVEWDVSAMDAYAQRKAVVFAGNDLPDGVFALTDEEVLNYSSDGLIIPLNDSIEQYAPNLSSLLDSREDIRKMLTFSDGNIYGTVSGEEQRFMVNPDVMYINQQWLDNLGLENPTTYDEWVDVLRAFKAEDANGNGDPNDEIPFTAVYDGSNTSQSIFSLFGMFGMLDTPNHINVSDGEVYFSANTEEYKQALISFSELYAEGLWDPEIFTPNTSQYIAKHSQLEPSIVGSFIEYVAENYNVVEDVQEVFTFLPALVGPDGDQMWNNYTNLSRGAFAITMSAEYPNIMMRWVDALYDPWMSLEWDKGSLEGGLYKTEDGNWGFSELPEGTIRTEVRFNEAPVTGPRFLPESLFEILENPNLPAVIKGEYFDVNSQYFAEEIYPMVIYTSEQTQSLDVLRADINPYVTQMTAQFITQGGVEEGWDEYVTTLNNMGLEELVQINQDAYNSYMNG